STAREDLWILGAREAHVYGERMTFTNSARVRAEQYHKALPEEIRRYLQGRGIASSKINEQLIGWDGRRITIPTFGRQKEVLTFRFVRWPIGQDGKPQMMSETGSC